jgi:hypothetical protein
MRYYARKNGVTIYHSANYKGTGIIKWLGTFRYNSLINNIRDVVYVKFKKSTALQ